LALPPQLEAYSGFFENPSTEMPEISCTARVSSLLQKLIQQFSEFCRITRCQSAQLFLGIATCRTPESWIIGTNDATAECYLA